MRPWTTLVQYSTSEHRTGADSLKARVRQTERSYLEDYPISVVVWLLLDATSQQSETADAKEDGDCSGDSDDIVLTDRTDDCCC